MRPADQFPPIVLSTDDYERLANLVLASVETVPAVSEYLAQELDRAMVLAPGEVARNVVTMNARVVFVDDKTGQTRTITLAYPHNADLSAGRISVLTPIGAALIGVAEGQSICWYTRSGEARTLTVRKVEPHPEVVDHEPA